jgi:rhodanese-related sulfurtransferase
VNYRTIEPLELRKRLQNGEEVRLIDVREFDEYMIARVEGAELLPLSQFNEWVKELNPEEEIVFLCHHGIRSAQVCAFLSGIGFEKLYNLAGGIDLWALEVDRSVPRY